MVGKKIKIGEMPGYETHSPKRECIIDVEQKNWHQKTLPVRAEFSDGGALGIRTNDFYDTSIAHYQLCYDPQILKGPLGTKPRAECW